MFSLFLSRGLPFLYLMMPRFDIVVVWRCLASSGAVWRRLARRLASYGLVWRRLSSSGAVWRRLACRLVSCGVVWRRLASSGVVWDRLALSGVVCRRLALCDHGHLRDAWVARGVILASGVFVLFVSWSALLVV